MTKKKTTSKEAELRKPENKPRRKVIMPKDDEEDEEKTKYDDLRQFNVVVHKRPQTTKEVCEIIRKVWVYLNFNL